MRRPARVRPRAAVCLALLLSAIPLVADVLDTITSQSPAVVITIDPTRTYQTFRGWGANLSFMRDLNFVSQATVDQVIDEAVNDLGLTFLRLGVGYLSEPFNDNADPSIIDWKGFLDQESIEREGKRGLLAFARLVRANGETPAFLLNKDWRELAPSWMSNAEFAEHIAATLLYYRDHLGIDITFTTIDNEPDHGDPYTPEREHGIVKVLGPALKRFGLSTTIALDEGLSPQTVWNTVSAMGNDRNVWPYIGLLNWHLYGPTEPFRSQIREVGIKRGIPTAQTEAAAGIGHLIDDLTLGGVSYWIRYQLADAGGLGAANYFVMGRDGTSFLRNYAYWRFRQFMRYVRPGAVRVEAASSGADMRAFAFDRDGKRVVIVNNDRKEPSSVRIKGLPRGQYGASQGTDRGYVELGVRDADSSGAVDVTVPPEGTLTLYPYSGVNQAPIVTTWTAVPRFLTLPATSVRLVAAAQDVEIEKLSFTWEISRQPEGAAVELSSSSGSEIRATGLDKAGEYVFSVTVRDVAGASTLRVVTLRVYDGNQPPVIAEGHRFFKDGRMILPKSTITYGPLFISAFDLDGDPVKTQFSVVSQPPKAAAKFDGVNASGLTVPGTYTFRFTASDPTHTSTRDFQQIVVKKP